MPRKRIDLCFSLDMISADINRVIRVVAATFMVALMGVVCRHPASPKDPFGRQIKKPSEVYTARSQALIGNAEAISASSDSSQRDFGNQT